MVAVVVLALLRTDMTFLRLNTNLTTVTRAGSWSRSSCSAPTSRCGRHVRMTGMPRPSPRAEPLDLTADLAARSSAIDPSFPCSSCWAPRAWRPAGRAATVITVDWAATILRSAVPLAILAGARPLTMLTGGIDLSVGAVASMSGFVVATLVGGPGLAVGIGVALAAAAAGRTGHRRRRRDLPRPSTDHDARHEPGRAGAGRRVAAPDGADRLGRPGEFVARRRHDLRICRTASSSSSRWPRSS